MELVFMLSSAIPEFKLLVYVEKGKIGINTRDTLVLV